MATATKLGAVRQAGEVPCSRLLERHFSPAELAEQWKLSADTVRRMFETEPGVLVFENPVRSSSRRFRTLRIPESVAQRVYSRFTNSGLAVGSRMRA